MTVSNRPTRVSSVLAMGVGLGSLMIGMRGQVTLAIGTVGLLLFAAGLLRASRDMLGWGALGIVLAALVQGLVQPTANLVVVQIVGGILAWDLGEHSIGLGEQMGWAAPTARQELVHAGGSLVVGIAGIVLWLIGREFTPPTLGFSSLLIMISAVVILIAAIR